MKYLFLFVGLVISWNCSAQEPVGAIELPEMNILFRGYPNKVIPAVTNNDGRTLVLTAFNARVTKEENEDFFIVKPEQGRRAILSISLRGEDGKTELIKKVEYRVLNLPDPELYWGAIKNGGIGNIESKNLFVKHPPLFPLEIPQKIISWEMSCGNDTISGVSSNISTAEEFLKKVPSQAIVLMEIVVVDSEGIQRFRKGHWRVASLKEETKLNSPNLND